MTEYIYQIEINDSFSLLEPSKYVEFEDTVIAQGILVQFLFCR